MDKKFGKRRFDDITRFILMLALVVLTLRVVVSPLGLFTAHDALYQVLAACLGAMVTAVITFLLLKSQSKQQQELQAKMAESELNREKASKVYEEKLHIYKEYLEKLCEVVKDRQVTNEEKIQLQFQTAYTAMHTSDAHVKGISECTSEILQLLCSNNSSDDSYKDAKDIQIQLFNLVRCFEEELYGKDKEKNEELRQTAAEIFAKMFDQFDSDESDQLTTTVPCLDDKDFAALVSKLNCPTDWECKQQVDGFRLQRKNKTGAVEAGFWEGHYYIQAEYGGFSDFAKALKRKYGGRRSYGIWWRHITEPGFYETKQGEMLSLLSQNDSMQKVMSDWINKLVKDIESFEPYANWWQWLKDKGVIGKYSQNWKFWIWADDDTQEFKCLVCDFDNAKLGKPFLDTYKEKERTVIVLWNRANEEGYTEELLKLIDSKSIESLDNNRRVLYSLPITATDKEVAEKISEIINCIDTYQVSTNSDI